MKLLRSVSPLLTLILIAGVVLVFVQSDQQERASLIEGRVAWISDGDTIRIDGHAYPVRLWGIDAPERETRAGERSRQFLIDQIADKPITCRRRAVDQYRRTVADCEVAGKNLSKMMIAAGQAIEYCRFTRNAYGTC